ncbi:hypothetical protein ABHN05_07240 [Brevibacillus laterosporus]
MSSHVGDSSAALLLTSTSSLAGVAPSSAILSIAILGLYTLTTWMQS